jgi:hypothetical protein
MTRTRSEKALGRLAMRDYRYTTEEHASTEVSGEMNAYCEVAEDKPPRRGDETRTCRDEGGGVAMNLLGVVMKGGGERAMARRSE